MLEASTSYTRPGNSCGTNHVQGRRLGTTVTYQSFNLHCHDKSCQNIYLGQMSTFFSAEILIEPRKANHFRAPGKSAPGRHIDQQVNFFICIQTGHRGIYPRYIWACGCACKYIDRYPARQQKNTCKHTHTKTLTQVCRSNSTTSRHLH